MIAVTVIVFLVMFVAITPVTIHLFGEHDKIFSEVRQERKALLAQFDGGTEYLSQLEDEERLEFIKQNSSPERYAEVKIKYIELRGGIEASGLTVAFSFIANIMFGILAFVWAVMELPDFIKRKKRLESR